MKKTVLYLAIGAIAGAIAGGIGGYIFRGKRDEKGIDQLGDDLATARLKAIDTEHEMKGLQNELKLEKDKTENLLTAIRQFCDENTQGCIIDLVNSRLTVAKMTKEGYSEEDITEALTEGKYRKLVTLYGSDEGEERKVVLNGSPEDAHEEWHDAEETDEEEEDEDDDEVPAGCFRNGDLIITPGVPRGHGVHLISVDEYGVDDAYSQIVLQYYSEDHVLADEDDDTVDMRRIGGEETLRAFELTDEDNIFVRNESTMTEYEIIWEDDAYSKAVLGMSPNKYIRDQRIFRNRKGRAK